MYAREVVPHVKQGALIAVIPDLLREGVRKLSEATCLHSDREVLSFDVRRAHIVPTRHTDYNRPLDAKTFRRAVAFLRFRP
jgi:hypothetical protein